MKKSLAKSNYEYSVIKRQRGLDGKWFRYPGTGYPSLDDAINAAAEFAAAQAAAGIGGTEIDVRARRGKTVVVTYRWDRGAVSMVDWRD